MTDAEGTRKFANPLGEGDSDESEQGSGGEGAAAESSHKHLHAIEHNVKHVRPTPATVAASRCCRLLPLLPLVVLTVCVCVCLQAAELLGTGVHTTGVHAAALAKNSAHLGREGISKLVHHKT
jgi:hypothetical protein